MNRLPNVLRVLCSSEGSVAVEGIVKGLHIAKSSQNKEEVRQALRRLVSLGYAIVDTDKTSNVGTFYSATSAGHSALNTRDQSMLEGEPAKARVLDWRTTYEPAEDRSFYRNQGHKHILSVGV